MIDPRKITPLLSNMTVDREIGSGPNGVVYLVTRRLDGKKMALKHISIPASDAQTKALIFAKAVANEADAQRYYSALVKDIKTELLLLNGIKNAPNLLKFRGYQVDQKFIGSGFDVYLLSDYCRTLPEYLTAHPLTKLQAVNLAIDLCSALEQLRSAGLIHKDIRPNNIYLGDNRHFLVGDLGLVKLDELQYSSMPDQLLTEYTAPEVVDSEAPLSATMDIYSVGLILYEIYNGGILPIGEQDHFVRTDCELPAPAYADMALSEIILKACAFDPEVRYQTPAEMKQALILYMQRGNVSSTPLVPQPEPETDAEVDVATIAATVAAGQEESATAEDASPAEDAAEPSPLDVDPGFVLDEPQEEVPKISLNDLSEDDLLVPTEGEISVEDFLASIRNTPGLEVLSMDDDGNTVTVPGYETEDSLPEGTEFVDSADNRIEPTVQPQPESSDEAQEETTEPDEPEASQEPEPYDPAQEQVQEASEPLPDPEPQEEEPQEQPEPPRRRRQRSVPRNDDPNVYDDGYEEENYEDYEDEDDDQPSGTWKKALIAVIVLLVLAGGAFTLYMFKTDTVSDMNTQVLSSSSVQITADTKNSSAVEVICSTATGEVARLPLTDSGATFTGLSPSTTYTFTLSSSEGKLLLGSKTTEATTDQMTNLTGFAASTVSATSVDLAIRGTGDQPDKWIITCTAENGDSVTGEGTDASKPITVEGLTPATTYTATIARGDGDQLGGTTTCTFTTMDYTVLESFEMTDIDTDSTTVQWVYSGTVPDSWTVTCEGTDGSSTTQEVSGTECTLDGLTSGVTYTVSISCPSLKETDKSTITVGVPSVTITEVSSVQNEDGNIEVTWEYTSDTTPTQWSVSYVYASESEPTATLITSDTNSVILENPIPEAEYTITIESADEFHVGGSTQTTCVTGEASDFTEFGCSDVSMSLYVLEDNPDTLENSTDTFTTSQHIAFAIQANYEETEEDKNVTTMYVIRNSNGQPVYVYRNDDPGRSWSGSWTTARHTGDLPDTIEKPGSYTLEVYFNGDLLAEADFTVTE